MYLRITLKNSVESSIKLPPDVDRRQLRSDIEAALSGQSATFWVTTSKGDDVAIPTAEIMQIHLVKHAPSNSSTSAKHKPAALRGNDQKDLRGSMTKFPHEPKAKVDRESRQETSLPENKKPSKPKKDRVPFKGKPIKTTVSSTAQPAEKPAWQPEPSSEIDFSAFFHRIKIPVAIVGLPILLIGFLYFTNPAESTTTDSAEAIATTELEERELISELIKANKLDTRLAFDLPSQIEAWNEQIRLADSVLANSENKEDLRLAFTTKVDALLDFSEANRAHNLEDETPSTNLCKITTEYIEHDDAATRQKASSGLVFGKIYGYLSHPSDEKFDAVVQKLSHGFDSIEESTTCAQEIETMVKLLKTSDRVEHKKTVCNVGRRFAQTER